MEAVASYKKQPTDADGDRCAVPHQRSAREPEPEWRRGEWICAVVGLVVLSVSAVLFGQWRFIAPDEGFYLYAGRLVQEGVLPYRDFFFPQAPLSPCLFAAWFWVAGRSWVLARVFASVVTIAACVVLARLALAVYGRRAALWSLLAFALCAGVQLWLPTAKSTGFSALFLALGLDAFLRRGCAKRASFWLGLSVLARATMAPAALFLLVPLSRERGAYGKQVRGILLGAAVPALVGLAFLLLDPFNFWQGNFGYHLERSTFSDRYVAHRRWEIFRGLFGYGPDAGLGGFQFGLLAVGAALSLVSAVRAGWRKAVLPLVALILAAVNFLPEPPHLQYFSIVSFLMVPPAVAALDAAVSALQAQRCPVGLRRLAPAVALCASVLFAALGWEDAWRFVVTGERVVGVGKHSGDSWRVEKMAEVSRAIDAANSDGKPVLSGWAGYLVETESQALKGTENHFAFSWAQVNGFAPAEQDRRHILSLDRAVDAFVRGDAKLAVAYAGPGRTRALLDALQAKGAKRVAQVGFVEIVERGGQ